MRREAKVIIRNGKPYAEFVRSEACGSCHACEMGMSKQMRYPLEGSFTEGETVYLEVGERALKSATLLAYGLPLCCLLAGLVLGFILFKSEIAQAICAIVSLGIALFMLALSEKKRRRSGKYKCTASKE